MNIHIILSIDYEQGGGRIGSIILRGLLSAPDLSITAIKRPESKSTFPTAANLKVVESNLSFDSLVSIFKGNDAVISVVGATGISEQKPYVDAAVAAGIRRFLPSEFGVNGQSKTVQDMTPFFAVKQELLNYLVEKEKDGLTWTGLIVGALFDWVRLSHVIMLCNRQSANAPKCLANGFIGFDLEHKRAMIWDDGNTIFSGLNEEDLGKAVVGVLKHPKETANQFVYASSIAASQKEILAALEQATSSKFEVSHVSTGAQLDGAREALGKGDFSGAFTIVKATVLGNAPGLQQHFEVEEKDRLKNDILGIKKTTVQDTVDRILASGEYSGAYF